MFLKPLDEEVSQKEGDPKELSPVRHQRTEDGWTCVRYVADTGAERSVQSASVCPDREVRPSVTSRQGRNFTGPDGGEIINQGEVSMPAMSPEGVWTVQDWDVAAIQNPLLSVTQECDKGQLAIFGAKGGVVLNLVTGATRYLNRVGGTYEGEMWVPPASLEQAAASLSDAMTFQWPDW